MFLEFFAWWYGKGWQEVARVSLGLVKKVQLSFSIPILIKTLVAPWKRIISPPGLSIDDKMRALLDNLISRTVGFFVRIFALISAIVLIAIASVTGVVLTVSWPLVPVLIVYSAFRGLTG